MSSDQKAPSQKVVPVSAPSKKRRRTLGVKRGGHGQKKRCEFCIVRHIKCDRPDRIPCSECVKRHLECHFVPKEGKMGRGVGIEEEKMAAKTKYCEGKGRYLSASDNEDEDRKLEVVSPHDQSECEISDTPDPTTTQEAIDGKEIKTTCFSELESELAEIPDTELIGIAQEALKKVLRKRRPLPQ